MTSTHPAAKSFAIAIHAGAGVIARTIPDEKQQQYLDSLNTILTHGTNMLQNGASAIDTVEEITCMLEDDPKFNAGKGAVYTREAKHELEAAIMEGSTLRCGAVTGLRTVKNPITLARQIMQHSQHIFLMGEGAESFADTTNVKRVQQSYYDTPHRLEQLRRFLRNHNKNHNPQVVEDANTTNPETHEGSTVGCVALDQKGNLAAATSTGGMTGKQFNRIGDSPSSVQEHTQTTKPVPSQQQVTANHSSVTAPHTKSPHSFATRTCHCTMPQTKSFTTNSPKVMAD